MARRGEAVTAPDVRAAAELIHDALDAAEESYHERERGIIDTTSGQLAAALLAAGWRPPAPQGHVCRPEGDPAQLPSATRWTCPEDGTTWVSVKRMVGRTMHGEWQKTRY
jgi:hypothetical protein